MLVFNGSSVTDLLELVDTSFSVSTVEMVVNFRLKEVEKKERLIGIETLSVCKVDNYLEGAEQL